MFYVNLSYEENFIDQFILAKNWNCKNNCTNYCPLWILLFNFTIQNFFFKSGFYFVYSHCNLRPPLKIVIFRKCYWASAEFMLLVYGFKGWNYSFYFRDIDSAWVVYGWITRKLFLSSLFLIVCERNTDNFKKSTYHSVINYVLGGTMGTINSQGKKLGELTRGGGNWK